MLRIAILTLVVAIPAAAQGFTFTIGSPVASQDFQFKVASFVFRTDGCADPGKAQISATAEGIVKASAGQSHSKCCREPSPASTPSTRAGPRKANGR